MLHGSWGSTWIWIFSLKCKNIWKKISVILSLKFFLGCYETCLSYLLTYIVMFLSLHHPVTKKQIPNFLFAFSCCSNLFPFLQMQQQKILKQTIDFVFLITMKQWKKCRFHNWLDLFQSTVQTKFSKHKLKQISNSHLIKLLIYLFTYKLRIIYFLSNYLITFFISNHRKRKKRRKKRKRNRWLIN